MKQLVALLAIIAPLLAGCDQISPPKKPPVRSVIGEGLANIVPTQVTRSINGNQLLVIDVPVQSLGSLTEVHHCFVWRDLDFKTSSISCANERDFEIKPDKN